MTPGKKPASAAPHPLDAVTGGAFSAPTSGERAARIREWLATDPGPDQMNEVFKELSHRDRGAAKPLKEKLDEQRRLKTQEQVGAEWAAKGITTSTYGLGRHFNEELMVGLAQAWIGDAVPYEHRQPVLARFLIDGHKHDAIVLQTLQPQEYAHDTEVEKQHDNRCQPIESTPILLGLIIEG